MRNSTIHRGETTGEEANKTATILAPKAEEIRLHSNGNGQSEPSERDPLIWEIDEILICGVHLDQPGEYDGYFKIRYWFMLELTRDGGGPKKYWDGMEIKYDGESYIELKHVMKWWIIMFTLSNISIDEKATKEYNTGIKTGHLRKSSRNKEGIILNSGEAIRTKSQQLGEAQPASDPGN